MGALNEYTVSLPSRITFEFFPTIAIEERYKEETPASPGAVAMAAMVVLVETVDQVQIQAAAVLMAITTVVKALIHVVLAGDQVVVADQVVAFYYNPTILQ